MPELRTSKSLVAVARLAASAAVGGFLFGYDSAVINGAVGAIGDHYSVGATGLGFVVSSALLGAAVGAIVAGRGGGRFRWFAPERGGGGLVPVTAPGAGPGGPPGVGGV